MRHLQLRKINLKVLFGGGLGYRCFIICCNTAWFFFGFKTLPYAIHGIELTLWQCFIYAITASLIWNIINTGLYFLWHYWFIRFFKYGKE